MADDEKRLEYYQVLGLQEGATQDEIRKAYKNHALKCHPDKNQMNPEATKEFQRISEAYTNLTCQNDDMEELDYVSDDDDDDDGLSLFYLLKLFAELKGRKFYFCQPSKVFHRATPQSRPVNMQDFAYFSDDDDEVDEEWDENAEDCFMSLPPRSRRIHDEQTNCQNSKTAGPPVQADNEARNKAPSPSIYEGKPGSKKQLKKKRRKEKAERDKESSNKSEKAPAAGDNKQASTELSDANDNSKKKMENGGGKKVVEKLDDSIVTAEGDKSSTAGNESSNVINAESNSSASHVSSNAGQSGGKKLTKKQLQAQQHKRDKEMDEIGKQLEEQRKKLEEKERKRLEKMKAKADEVQRASWFSPQSDQSRRKTTQNGIPQSESKSAGCAKSESKSAGSANKTTRPKSGVQTTGRRSTESGDRLTSNRCNHDRQTDAHSKPVPAVQGEEEDWGADMAATSSSSVEHQTERVSEQWPQSRTESSRFAQPSQQQSSDLWSNSDPFEQNTWQSQNHSDGFKSNGDASKSHYDPDSGLVENVNRQAGFRYRPRSSPHYNNTWSRSNQELPPRFTNGFGQNSNQSVKESGSGFPPHRGGFNARRGRTYPRGRPVNHRVGSNVGEHWAARNEVGTVDEDWGSAGDDSGTFGSHSKLPDHCSVKPSNSFLKPNFQSSSTNEVPQYRAVTSGKAWKAMEPGVNVWSERKEFYQSVAPKDASEEERMLLDALEMSRLMEEEEQLRIQLEVERSIKEEKDALKSSVMSRTNERPTSHGNNFYAAQDDHVTGRFAAHARTTRDDYWRQDDVAEDWGIPVKEDLWNASDQVRPTLLEETQQSSSARDFKAQQVVNSSEYHDDDDDTCSEVDSVDTVRSNPQGGAAAAVKRSSAFEAAANAGAQFHAEHSVALSDNVAESNTYWTKGSVASVGCGDVDRLMNDMTLSSPSNELHSQIPDSAYLAFINSEPRQPKVPYSSLTIFSDQSPRNSSKPSGDGLVDAQYETATTSDLSYLTGGSRHAYTSACNMTGASSHAYTPLCNMTGTSGHAYTASCNMTGASSHAYTTSDASYVPSSMMASFIGAQPSLSVPRGEQDNYVQPLQQIGSTFKLHDVTPSTHNVTYISHVTTDSSAYVGHISSSSSSSVARETTAVTPSLIPSPLPSVTMQPTVLQVPAATLPTNYAMYPYYPTMYPYYPAAGSSLPLATYSGFGGVPSMYAARQCLPEGAYQLPGSGSAYLPFVGLTTLTQPGQTSGSQNLTASGVPRASTDAASDVVHGLPASLQPTQFPFPTANGLPGYYPTMPYQYMPYPVYYGANAMCSPSAAQPGAQLLPGAQTQSRNES